MIKEIAKLGRNLEDFAVNPNEYESRRKTLQENWYNIRSMIDAQLYAQDVQKNFSITVTSIQKRLTDIANATYHHYKKFLDDSNNDLMVSFLEEFGNDVSGSVEYLSVHFPDYFDRKKGIPLWLPHANKHISSLRARIVHNLMEKRTDATLTLIMEEHLDCLQLPGDFRVKNWHQYEYLMDISEELERFAHIPPTSDCTLSLIKLLIGHNFNPLAFYEFLLRYKSKVAGKDENPYEEQEMALLELLETIQDIRPERKDGYNTEAPNIGESISGSIKRELEIIRQRKSILSPFPINGNRIPPYYFEVTCSLKELFLIIRVMVKTGFIRVKSLSSMFEFAKRHIKFKTTKEPSERYMRNLVGKTQVVPRELAMKVRTLLAVMINYIDSYYLKH